MFNILMFMSQILFTFYKTKDKLKYCTPDSLHQSNRVKIHFI